MYILKIISMVFIVVALNKSPNKLRALFTPIYSAPGATRTRNQLIRSQVLYPLSYGGERG